MQTSIVMTFRPCVSLCALLLAFTTIHARAQNEVQLASLLSTVPTDNPEYYSPPVIPTIVGIGMHLIKLEDVSEPEALDPSFTARFVLMLNWKDPRLAAQPGQPRNMRVYQEENALGELERIWQPDISFENELGKAQLENIVLSISPVGDVVLEQGFTSKFDVELDFHRFPFDDQRLAMKLASFHAGNTNVRLRLEEGRTLIEPNASLPEWNITGFTSTITPVRGLGFDQSVSQAIFAIEADREGDYYIYKILLPFALVTMLSWSNFWITGKGDGRIRLTFLCLLALLAYSSVLSKYLPRLNVITFMDAIAFIGIGALTINVVENTWVHYLIRNGDEEKAERLDLWARRTVPAGVLLMMFLTAAFYLS